MPRVLKDYRLKVSQRCIGFKTYHIEFFGKHPEFKPDKYCRDIIDEQIKVIDPELWENIEKLEEENEEVPY